ncbi:MAG: hypothetical protein AAGA11_05460 [Pseudomonadota bacterium]
MTHTNNAVLHTGFALFTLLTVSVLEIEPVADAGVPDLLPQVWSLDAVSPTLDIEKAKFVRHTRNVAGRARLWHAHAITALLNEAVWRNDPDLVDRVQRHQATPHSAMAQDQLTGAVVDILRANGYGLLYPTEDAEALVLALESGSLAGFFDARIPPPTL